MTINIETLSLVLAFLGITQLIFFILLSCRYPQITGLRANAWGSFLLILGVTILFHEYLADDSLLYVVMSNLFIVIGVAVIYYSIERFLGIKRHIVASIIILTIFAAGFLYFTFIKESMNGRIAIFSFCFSIFSGVTAVPILFGTRYNQLFSVKLMGIILGLCGLFFFARGVMAIFSERIINFFDPTMPQVVAFLGAIIISFSWSFGLIFMIFERINTEKKEAQDRFKVIFEALPDMTCITDTISGRFVEVNDKFIEFVGRSREEITGLNAHDLLFWKTQEERRNYISTLLKNTRIENFEADIPRKDGVMFTILMSSRLIDYQGKTHILSIIRDIDVRKNLERELQLQAQTDMLTGIANRRYFFECLENEIKHSTKTMNESVFMMLDIDRFKKVNDKFGHVVGDAAIKMVVEAAKSVLRSSDLLGRIGGEEFGVLLVNTDTGEAEKIAEKMRQNVQDIELFSNEGVRVYLRISIGISKYRHEKDNVEQMISRADKALYRAKEEGRNQVAVIW